MSYLNCFPGSLNMVEINTETQQLMDMVVQEEWEMFHHINSSNNANCLNNETGFKAIRSSIYHYWEQATLASYLEDLRAAKHEGRNLVAEKYAYMEGQLTGMETGEMSCIVDIENRWQKQIAEMYPAVYQRLCRKGNDKRDGYDFETYLLSELKTYSPATQDLYLKQVLTRYKKGENPAIDSLADLVSQRGYDSIDQLETLLKGSSPT